MDNMQDVAQKMHVMFALETTVLRVHRSAKASLEPLLESVVYDDPNTNPLTFWAPNLSYFMGINDIRMMH